MLYIIDTCVTICLSVLEMFECVVSDMLSFYKIL